MQYRFRFLIVMLMMVMLVVPAAAAERVDELPDIRSAMTGRFDLAVVINDIPFLVGKGEVTSPTRAHFVLKALAIPGLPEDEGGRESTLEVVVYDDKVYVREDDDPQWYSSTNVDLPVSGPEAPDMDVSGAPISSIGSKVIAGVPTNQYQIWINNEEVQNEYAKLDFFIGQQINYLYQYQISAIAQDEDIGELKLEQVIRMYDFDDPSIIVGPPANAMDLPTPTSTLISPLRNGGLLSTLAAPLATAELRALAVERFGR